VHRPAPNESGRGGTAESAIVPGPQGFVVTLCTRMLYLILSPEARGTSFLPVEFSTGKDSCAPSYTSTSSTSGTSSVNRALKRRVGILGFGNLHVEGSFSTCFSINVHELTQAVILPIQ
jgi:hypothetical protein